MTDKYFTIPGVIVITVGGLMAAIYGHFPILRTGWILWSIILFSISGLAFALKLLRFKEKFINRIGDGKLAGFDFG